VLCRIRTIGVLALAGTPSYVLCYFRHICMAGHMHHPPYAWYEWLNDAWWVACLVVVFVFSVRTEARRKGWLLWGSLFLVFSRLFLGSVGGAGILLEAPVLLVLVFYGAMYMFKPGRYARATRVPDPIGEQEKGAEYP
jgi:hypothetical protein